MTNFERGTSAQAITRLLAVLLPDARTVLDMTYGSGNFWDGTAPVEVYGIDRDPDRARDACLDWTRPMPFAAGAFDVAIFDPPYITNAGATSIMGKRFGSFKSIPAMKEAVEIGVREAARVSRIGIIVKVQNQNRSGRFLHMTRWVEDALAPMQIYDQMHLASPSKVEDGRWDDQLSLRSAHSTFTVFRHDGPYHRRRKVSASA